MIIDAHLHTTGRERADEVLHAFDEAGVDIGVLLAPFLSEGYSLDDPASLRRANEHLARLVQGHADRLVGFAVVDPRDPGAPQELRRAVETLGLRGCKMVPTGWYPYDDAVQPVFATARELGIPLLFHSGIFIDGRSGRFCRPTFFEALRAHPGLKVTLAHLGWPWTDEAIAVGLIDLLNEVAPAQCMFRFDISFGAPPPYRREVLHKALEVLGPGLLQFGSDCFLPCSGAHLAERVRWVRELLDELEVPQDAREQVWSGTAAAWLGIDPSRRAPPPGRSPHRQLHPIADCTRAARTLPDPFSPLSFWSRVRMTPRCC
ncbi:amidohydrolase family protein [Caldimonas tepidiphila]|uniref:amidohydrolase family protein n=1 Tax=Caldimonas tepidiphila TaxID=2315841 RepID=UPI000E5AE740|nr:amidohydrolase family protein [Caldimonas tepidiphila]